jgi:hypothetical protein
VKTQEETVGLIRNSLIEVIEELEAFRTESGVHSPRLKHAAVLMECLAIDFERLVRSLPVEARS